MKLSVIAVLSVAMIALASSMAAADVITTGSSGVCFAAYNPGFTVSSSSLIGDHCSAGIQGDVFHVEATGTDYRDAGIVLYNDCSLKLGDLQSVSAASNNNAALCINLWLDTGGNGKLFSYDANGTFLSLDGDAYGASNSTGTATLTGSSTFAFFLGADVGTHTLADLQAGLVSGITANTPVAIWIGLTNRADGATASADISSVTVVPEPATMGLLILGGLAALARRRQRA